MGRLLVPCLVFPLAWGAPVVAWLVVVRHLVACLVALLSEARLAVALVVRLSSVQELLRLSRPLALVVRRRA